MANKTVTIYLRGRVFWAKIFGDPRPNYNRDGREWTFEFEPEDYAAVKNAGINDKLKDKSDKKGYEGRAPFMTLKQKELDFEGNKRDPIRVVDADRQPWPDDKLLGNGTVVDVKLGIVDYGPGKRAGVYPNAIRVLDLVPYASSDFAPLDETDPYKPKDTFAEDFGIAEDKPEPKVVKSRKKAPVEEGELDDDVPF